MIVMVCGLSKCGKSSVIDAAKSTGAGWTSIKSSRLLRKLGRPTTRLTAAQALGNQFPLSDEIVRIGDSGKLVVLDGHLLIETTEGPQLVPDSSFANLELIGLIAVTVDPDVLSKRRVGSIFTTDREELVDLMLIENAQARRLARKLDIPYFQIENEDPTSFSNAVNACVMSLGAKRH